MSERAPSRAAPVSTDADQRQLVFPAKVVDAEQMPPLSVQNQGQGATKTAEEFDTRQVSNIKWWAYFDGRQNRLRDVAGPGRLTKVCYHTIMTARHGRRLWPPMPLTSVAPGQPPQDRCPSPSGARPFTSSSDDSLSNRGRQRRLVGSANQDPQPASSLLSSLEGVGATRATSVAFMCLLTAPVRCTPPESTTTTEWPSRMRSQTSLAIASSLS